jgi:hypothetical protein
MGSPGALTLAAATDSPQYLQTRRRHLPRPRTGARSGDLPTRRPQEAGTPGVVSGFATCIRMDELLLLVLVPRV